MKRTLLVICSDLHGGHRHGLCSPETVLHEYDEHGAIVEDYHPTLNPVQAYLWRMYLSQIAAVGLSAKDDDVIVCMNGDMTAGNKHKSLLMSDRLADQIIIARYNMEPWYNLPHLRAVRFTKGTGAHVFEEGSSEILVAELARGYHPTVSTQVSDHSLLTIDGLTADISHHGPPPGSRNWLAGNEMRYYLRSLMLDEFAAGRIPPRLVYRAHYHRYVQESLTIEWGGKFHTSTIILTPSFTFPDGYTRKVVRSPARVTHGMTVTEIVDGELLRILPLIRTLDIRTKEVL
jgi:hypothetical protein